MKVLVLQNHPCEDAATAGTAFEDYGADIEVVDCYKHRQAPMINGDALLVLGGPMNVYEEQQYPFLKWETELIREWAEEGRPILGICLGAQLLSKATGGKITRNDKPEIGHFEVEQTTAGLEDPVFSGIRNPLPVVQWHQDTFSIPPGGTLLASGSTCKNQAFRIYRAVGLQFHLEIGREKMSSWMKEYNDDPGLSGLDPNAILKEFAGREAVYSDICFKLVQNFCRYDVADALKRRF